MPAPWAPSERGDLNFAFELIMPFVIFEIDPVNFTEPVSVNPSGGVVHVPDSFSVFATLTK
jgi:hypothetical protein